MGVFIVLFYFIFTFNLCYGIVGKAPEKEPELEQENIFPSFAAFFSSPWKHIEKQVLCALQAPRETFVLQLAKEML